MQADSIRITSDEDGFHLIIESADVPVYGSGSRGVLDFNIHDCAVELLQQVKEHIGPWYAEGQSVLANMHQGPQGDFRCAPEDVDESGGLCREADDPKALNFHSVHADIWDAREGK